MPWHREPKKDVTNCDKLRGAVSGLWSADFRMEQSGKRKVLSSYTEYIGIWGEPPELKHVKPGGNTGGPSSKPKYYSVTDSEEVLWRKGEKYPWRGVKKNLKPCVYKHRKLIKERSGTFCRMVRRVNVTGEVKHLRCEAAARASLNRAYEVGCIRPETGWPTHGQVEVKVKLYGGPNRLPLKW